MKCKVAKRFIDRETKKLREVDEVIEVTDARFKEISAAGKYLKVLADDAPGEKPLDKMKVDELKEYATAQGIDLGDAKTKAEIIEAIKAAETADDAEGEGDADGEGAADGAE